MRNALWSFKRTLPILGVLLIVIVASACAAQPSAPPVAQATQVLTQAPTQPAVAATAAPTKPAATAAATQAAASTAPAQAATTATPGLTKPAQPAAAGKYIVLGWNDLGMHCYNGDFSDAAILPPYNTLWAQVILVADPPKIVTQGIKVSYSFPDNKDSAGKTNFWQYAKQLFGVDLAPNVGLKGLGLAGDMSPAADHFEAVGIPLTEYSDSKPGVRAPFQLADIVVTDATTGAELTRNQVVAPVSTEMHCDNCHKDGGVGGIATGNVIQNLLTLHDQRHQKNYPAGHTGALMSRRPILCAECHSSNALGAAGAAGLPSLSNAIHRRHANIIPATLDGCYNCHPGPQTQCLRDVMSREGEINCISCHGNMANVAKNQSPWLTEPRCDQKGCHPAGMATADQPLYRNSKTHGGIYCEGCHDSTHAIAPSREANDGVKFVNLQGHTGTLNTCTVCHATAPAASTDPQFTIPRGGGD